MTLQYSIYLFAAYAVLSAAHCAAILMHAGPFVRVSKAFLMPALLAVYLGSCLALNTGPNFFVILALAAGFAGDVLLQHPGIFFMLGLFAFLLGHAFYIGALLVPLPPYTAWLPASAVLYALFGALIYRRLWPNIRKFRVPILLYLIVELLMGIAAITRAGGSALPAALLLTGGSVLFIVSDSLLALALFVERKKWHDFTIMATYLAGQGLLAAAFLL